MNITDHIIASGLTRDEICRRAGVSRSMLSQIETGGRRAGLKTAASLARVLGISRLEIRPDIAAFASGDAA